MKKNLLQFRSTDIVPHTLQEYIYRQFFSGVGGTRYQGSTPARYFNDGGPKRVASESPSWSGDPLLILILIPGLSTRAHPSFRFSVSDFRSMVGCLTVLNSCSPSSKYPIFVCS